MRRHQRLIAAALMAAVIAGVFWSQSRIPALNEKAQMGLRTSFGELAFEIVLPLTPQQSTVERILRSSVNWAYTNLQGMTFGLLFAAAALTILANLRRRQFKSPWLNAVSGVFVGAPLGVCVNCATPIAFGIYSAGARLETALASLVASPTLNAIVLTMAFTLLPWELALAKTAGVALIIACIPFFVRRFAGAPDIEGARRIAGADVPALPALTSPDVAPESETLLNAVVATATQYLRNLWFLIKFALPLMLLAGVLGAIAIELVPFDTFTGLEAGIGALLTAGLVATFLPVPIAFDVVIVMALLSSGVDAGLAATLLFALGIYSIYPAALIARYISARLSIAVGVGVIVVAVGLGLATQYWVGEKIESNARAITAGLAQNSQALQAEAVSVCDALPGNLQVTCFARHSTALAELSPTDDVCENRPGAIDIDTCQAIVSEREIIAGATDSLDSGACAAIDTDAGRQRCAYSVVLRTAQTTYDVRQCDVLPGAAVDRCRADYLNASLLFNPDDSACNGLTGNALDVCRVNAEIYRYADALNIAACDTLEPAGARDHCRYTIASTMIGRHDDASGCERIDDAQMAERCRLLPEAWRAAKSRDYDACDDLVAVGLRDTCLLRVADRQIESILARNLIGRVEPGLSLDNREAIEYVSGNAPELVPQTLTGPAGVDVSFVPFNERTGDSGRFRKVRASALGVTSGWTFAVTDFFEPFIIGKGIASGDFNNDLWPDIVLATESGVRLYQNVGGSFALRPSARNGVRNSNHFIVAFVDLDGNGWQDIFTTAYGGTYYSIMNVDGDFDRAPVTVTATGWRLTMSAAFGDLDKNGELDIVFGNWSSGLEKLFATEQSGNYIVYQSDREPTIEPIAEIRGETNSVLISDMNEDGNPDVLIGNDRLVPDFYYLGNGAGELTPVPQSSVPLTSMFTMSLDSADFNNDLKLDLFSTDMTFARSSRDDYCATIDDSDLQTRCRQLLEIYDGVQADSADYCARLTDPSDRQACFSVLSVRAAKTLQDPEFCRILPDWPSVLISLCDYLAVPASANDPVDQSAFTPQVQRNTLLFGGDNGFSESAELRGVASSFWSWNAKAADLDNDGWQDIYVGNGFHFGENFFEIQDNVMFRNTGNAQFEEVQDDWGLDDPVNTPSYTYLDIDLDGDLDIVATGVIEEPRIYINELDAGNSLAVALTDERGNRFALGANVTVSYGPEPMRQRKEVKLGGGFLSFDNPVLYFGIGDIEQVAEIEVRWPDGEISTLAGPLDASGVYRINRRLDP